MSLISLACSPLFLSAVFRCISLHFDNQQPPKQPLTKSEVSKSGLFAPILNAAVTLLRKSSNPEEAELALETTVSFILSPETITPYFNTLEGQLRQVLPLKE
jgi:hypothetical protein